MTDTETITAAALSKNGIAFSLPQPARHHHVLHTLADMFPAECPFGDYDQGFITSAGRFVDREEGCRLALAADQIQTKHGPAHTLFSEDMW